MSIAIIFNNKAPEPWQEVLKRKLPNTNIEIYPHIKDKTTIRFALCWKPEKEVLRQFPSLEVVQSVGAAVEHITNTQQLPESISICRMVDPQLTRDMFEFLLAVVMSHLKRFSYYQQQQANKSWKPIPYRSMSETTVTILGLGEIGAYVAEKLAQLGFQVKGWSNSEKNIPKINSYSGQAQFEQALAESDVLINLLPSTASTQNILNHSCFQRLKKGAYLINVGRGDHLVEADLLAALTGGQLSGALLDVFREEPLPMNHPFWEHPQMSITPHIAAITNIDTASGIVVQNFKNMLEKQPLRHLVDVHKGY